MRWWKRSKPGRAGRWRSYIRSWIWEIQGHLEEIYGIEVSPSLISNVTDAVVEEVKAWQSRPLEELYPIVYLDAMMVKMRDSGHVQNQAIYVVLGVDVEGQKEVLGLWAAQREGD